MADSRSYDLDLVRACSLAYGVDPSMEHAVHLLRQGANVNARTTIGSTPLTEACASGSFELVQLLLDAGADPRLAGERGVPAITFAATGARRPEEASRIVELLLSRGADVDAQDERGATALLAVVSGNRYRLDVAFRLLEAGAEPLAALKIAAEKGYLELVQLLVARGVDADERQRALRAALGAGKRPVVEYLIKTGAAAGLDAELLAYAAAHGCQQYLQWVELAKVSDEERAKVLAIATRRGQLDFLKTLLVRGFELRPDDLFLTAAREGQLAVVSFLLEQGADVDAVDATGATAMIAAAARGQLAVLHHLHEAGAKLDLATENGRTALAWALGNDQEEAAIALRNMGATTGPLRRGSRTACGYCGIRLSRGESEHNLCPTCDAAYCDRHHEWTEWEPEQMTSDDLRRSAICPQGHRREEHQRAESGRSVDTPRVLNHKPRLK